MEAAEEKAIQAEQEASVKDAEQERIAAEAANRERMLEIKAAMSPEDREALRAEALSQIRESGIYQESLITDILLEIQENQILREKIEADPDQGEGQPDN